MEIANPFIFPPELDTAYREAERSAWALLNENKVKEADDIWKGIYEKIIEFQTALKVRLHKGGALHNLGITALLQNNLEWAFKNFVLAYAEDVASEEQGFAGKAEEGPAAKNLIGFFGVNEETLKKIRDLTKASIPNGEVLNPKEVFKDLLELQLNNPQVKEEIEYIKENPGAITEMYNISRIPGLREKRVFIGGSYRKDRRAILEKIKKTIIDLQFTPIIADEFDSLPTRVHDDALLLLHNCDFAIFDITINSGHLMELEKTRDYRTKTLLIHDKDPEPHISKMVETFDDSYSIKPFSAEEELEDIIKSFLN